MEVNKLISNLAYILFGGAFIFFVRMKSGYIKRMKDAEKEPKVKDADTLLTNGVISGNDSEQCAGTDVDVRDSPKMEFEGTHRVSAEGAAGTDRNVCEVAEQDEGDVAYKRLASEDPEANAREEGPNIGSTHQAGEQDRHLRVEVGYGSPSASGSTTEETGVMQQFGIFSALGLSLVFQGPML